MINHRLYIRVVCAVIVFAISNGIPEISGQGWIYLEDEIDLDINSVCKFKHNDSMGLCSPISSCPAAAEEYTGSRNALTTCTYKGQLVVCCMNPIDDVPAATKLAPIISSSDGVDKRISQSCE